MYFVVKNISSNKSIHLDLSRNLLVEDFKVYLEKQFNVQCAQQKIYCKGKLLVDGHTLHDYGISFNEILQLVVDQGRVVDNDDEDKVNGEVSKKNEAKGDEHGKENEEPEPEGGIYKVGDVVDVKDKTMGAWFEAIITKKVRPVVSDKKQSPIYVVKFEGPDESTDQIEEELIRPRACKLLTFKDLNIGDKVMLNYNYDEPHERGYWYDAVITDKKDTRKKSLLATVYVGEDLIAIDKVNIQFIDEIFQIESPQSSNIVNINAGDYEEKNKRKSKFECDSCRDDPKKKCKQCACCVCGDKKEPAKQILCDECDSAYHIYCLNPSLDAVPDADDWYCPDCKLDTSKVVRPGEKLKESKKRASKPSTNNKTKRDWDNGMACAGREKECNIVNIDQFGSIPGVEVGSTWKFRIQVSGEGVHRPPVSGIHGQAEKGAFSIAFSGGYEDDKDHGDEFIYTGSGGRDLSGNKRVSGQSCDQKLTLSNLALARNCDASVDSEKGGVAKVWQNGKPVRVIRSHEASKHSIYAPKEGYRYDGLYKVVKYWPEKGKSGFKVWKYLFRRDDPTPAPWTKEGEERMQKLGLKIEYPAGYEEYTKKKRALKEEGKQTKRRKVSKDEESEADQSMEESFVEACEQYVAVGYEIDSDLLALMITDVDNKKLWDLIIEEAKLGYKKFVKKTEEQFMCMICQEVVFQPVTLNCRHNVCKKCLKRSFKAEVYTCPTCRQDLDKNIITGEGNLSLQTALKLIFPGYENGR